MVSSAVRSMSETKSLKALLSIFTAGRLLAARSIMSPARRAALTAVLRTGFIFLRFGWWGQAAAGRLPENGKAVPETAADVWGGIIPWAADGQKRPGFKLAAVALFA